MAQKIGRFELVRELGRGAQSVVYLCNDPQLQREVAIKTVHFAQSGNGDSAVLLSEARTVSKLRHPNIVPIFEVGESEGELHLVFEYIEGESLAQILAKNPMDPLKAAEMGMAILDALSEAHGRGVIHRDLKPSNIIVDAKGSPHVMDFGIACRISEKSTLPNADSLMGTPPYMAPEYVRDRIISEKMDLYATGLILIEMLTGKRARKAPDLQSMLATIVAEPVNFPKNLGVNELLESAIMRAVAQDPEMRFESAARMRDALRVYLQPVSHHDGGALSSSADSAGGAAAVEFLLRRIRHKSDFPAFSDSVLAINRLTHSDKEGINKLSNSILKDYALTSKILRTVNSPVYGQTSGAISTVSRAVMVLGFDTVRNIALTVMMFEHLQSKSNINEIKEAFLRANLSGLIGRDIAQKMIPKLAEEAFICAMFHGLGRMLVQYYFPEEVDEIRRVIQQKNCSDEAAVRQVLGTSFEEIGTAIASHWGFPPNVISSMRRMPPGSVRKPGTQHDTLHMVSSYSNELCDAIASTPPEQRARALKQIADRYSAGVQFSNEQFKALMERTYDALNQMASNLHISLKQSPFARQAQAWSGEGGAPSTEGQAEAHGLDADMAQTMLTEKGLSLKTQGIPAANPSTLAGTAPVSGVTQFSLGAAEGGETPVEATTSESCNDHDHDNAQIHATLVAGIQDISNALLEDFSLNDLLRIILETMYRAMGFDRVILCLRDAKTNTMMGRFGFGVDTSEIVRKFRFALAGEADVFSVAVQKGVDIIITDINDPKIHDRIPAWHRQSLLAETFVLFPLLLKGKPIALIYCDKRKAGSILIPAKELTLLKTLRNQAVLAIKQTM